MHLAIAFVNIPLLVDLVCEHLSTRDIYRSTLVCRNFYLGFKRNIFHSIDIQSRGTFKKLNRKDTLNALGLQSNYIYSIKTNYAETCEAIIRAVLSYPCPIPSPTIDPIIFSRLRTLRFEYPKSSRRRKLLRNHDYLHSILSVVESCPNLESLYLGFFVFREPDYIQRLLSAIRKKGRRFKELDFSSNQKVGNRIIRQILWSCAALDRLTLDVEYADQLVILDDEPQQLQILAKEALSMSHTGDLIFQWRQLQLPCRYNGLGVSGILPVLRYCPLLEDLRVPTIQSMLPLSSLARYFSPAALPNLRHINLEYLDQLGFDYGFNIYTRKVLGIFSGIHSVTLGNRPSLEFTNVVTNWILQNISTTLETLTISESSNFRTFLIQRILSDCSMLKHFNALKSGTKRQCYSIPSSPVLEMRDIGIGKWTCLGLETLRLCFKDEIIQIGIPEVLARQISELTNIQVLHLMNTGTLDDRDRAYNMDDEQESIRKAFRLWGELKSLRELRLTGMRELVKKEDLASARNQWIKLERLYYD